MIDHIFLEIEKNFKGTTHGNDWMVQHDEVSLFVTKESYKYMQTRGYFEYLIVPLNGLSSSTPYTYHMVGVWSEAMPLNIHLNKILNEYVDRHAKSNSTSPRPKQFQQAHAKPSRCGIYTNIES